MAPGDRRTVIICRGSAEKENSLAYRGDFSGTVRKRIDRHHERLILVLYKVQVHKGTREMVERIFITVSHIISHNDVS